LKECFAASLYTCYDLVQPSVAMELAWKAGLMNLTMPYFIQVIGEVTNKVDKLEKKDKEEEKKKKHPETNVPVGVMGSPSVDRNIVGGPPVDQGFYGPVVLSQGFPPGTIPVIGQNVFTISGPGSAPPGQTGFGL